MRRFFRRIQQSVSLLLVAALFGQVLLRPGVAQAAAPAPTSAPALASAPAHNTVSSTAAAGQTNPEQQLSELIKGLRQQLKQATAERSKGGSATLPGAKPPDLGQNLQQALASLRELDKSLRQELHQAEQQQRAKHLPAVAAARQQQFAAQYDAQFTQLDSLLSDALAAPTDAARLAALEQALNDLTPPAPRALGTDLPHRAVTDAPRDPILGGSVTPAYAQGSTAELQPSALGADPTDADRADAGETQQTPAIKALAAQLGNDPVAIFEWVHNQIMFQPYYGSRKGAAVTLAEGGGNAWDLASLLISLLRAAGYPARYVTGTVALSPDQITGWTGLPQPQQAMELLASSGIPVRGVISGGNYALVQLDHAWVEAYLPIDGYRGLDAGAAEYGWIPLDPSFKTVVWNQGIDAGDVGGIDPRTLVDQLGATADVDDENGTVTAVDQSLLESQFDQASQQVQNYLSQQGMTPETSVSQMPHSIIPAELHGILPLSLPYPTAAVTGEYTAVPEQVKEQVSFSLSTAGLFGALGGATEMAWTAPTASLTGKRLTLSWRPATADDEQIIAAYGGLENTPAYLVKVLPELKLDGAVVATGQPVGYAQKQSFTMQFSAPDRSVEFVQNDVTAGAYYAVVLDTGAGGGRLLSDRLTKLDETKAQVTEANVWTDDALGELLSLLGGMYFGELATYRTLLGDSAGVVETRQTSEAMVAADLQVSYLFFSPISARPAGLNIDVDRDLVSPVSRTGDRQAVAAYMLASGSIGSAMEHSIFEQLVQTPAVSAIRILQAAQERGIPTITVNQYNADSVLPTLQVSQAVKDDIANAVQSGKLAVLPVEEVQYFNWRGSGYVIMDPATGAAGYMISGGLAGGATAMFVSAMTLVAFVGLAAMLGPAFYALVGLAIMPLETITLGTVAGAIWNLFIVGSTAYYGYSLVNTSYQYFFEHDEAAGNALINMGLLTVASAVGGYMLGKAIQAVAKSNPAVGQFINKVFAAIDRATYGQAAKLVVRGLTQVQVVEIAEAAGVGGVSTALRLGDEGVMQQVQFAAQRRINLNDAAVILETKKVDTLAAIGATGPRRAQVLAKLISEGAEVDDLAWLFNRQITVNKFKRFGILSASDVGPAKLLAQEFNYSAEDLQLVIRRINASAEIIEQLERSLPAGSVKAVAQEIDNLAAEFPVRAQSGRVALTPDQVRAVSSFSGAELAAQVRQVATQGGPGVWIRSYESMSEAAASYEMAATNKMVTGRSYWVNGVKFDGYDPATGELIDAKWGYEQFISKATGEWRDSFMDSAKGGVSKMLKQARNQVQAAGEGNVIWRVSNNQAADLIRETLETDGVSGIEVLFWPQP